MEKVLAPAGELWQGTLDSLSTHIAVLDEEGVVIAVNAAWRRFAANGGGSSDYVGSNYVSVCEAAAADPIAARVARGLGEILSGKRAVLELEYPCHSPSVQRWYLMRATRYAGRGALRVVVAHENITARREAQEQLFMQAALLDEVDVSVIVTDLDMIVRTWNAGAERLYGWTAEEAIGRPVSETVWPAAADPEASELAGAVLYRDGRSDRRVRRASQRRLDVPRPCSQPLDEEPGRDRDRRRQRRDRRDGAQGVRAGACKGPRLPARRDRQHGRRALHRRRRRSRRVHEPGCSGSARLDDRGAPGTGAFTPSCTARGWTERPCRSRSARSAEPRQDGELVRVEDDVFLRKDGRELPVAYTAAPFSTGVGIEGCVVLFEDITKRKAEALRVGRDLEKLTWLERIQEALTEKRFVLYAQPIIDLNTGEVVQREMLLRMRDAHHSDATPSVVLPGAFLPVAEEFGLITQIDHWVIDRSTEIAATGQAVEINVSGRSVSDPNLVSYISHAIEHAGADPTTIVFEITETTLASDEVAARAFVEGLHNLGCKVALDDFGTGYGGFTYLKQLPIDFLKIDIEFVRDLRSSSASRHVVEAIVNLAGGFALKTVGEGVEDQETLDLLRELGVDYAQGFHIGRPAPLETGGPHHHDSGADER